MKNKRKKCRKETFLIGSQLQLIGIFLFHYFEKPLIFNVNIFLTIEDFRLKYKMYFYDYI